MSGAGPGAIPLRRRVTALLTGREAVPAGFGGTLESGERVLATAAGRGGRVVVATDRGLWLDEHRVPWHLVSRASWSAGALEVVEAHEAEHLDGGVVLLADQPARRVPLVEPGRVPETVHRRVTDAIRTRQRVELAPGGAWFVQRRVGDRVVTHVRPDPGTDPDAVRALAVGVGEKLRDASSG